MTSGETSSFACMTAMPSSRELFFHQHFFHMTSIFIIFLIWHWFLICFKTEQSNFSFQFKGESVNSAVAFSFTKSESDSSVRATSMLAKGTKLDENTTEGKRLFRAEILRIVTSLSSVVASRAHQEELMKWVMFNIRTAHYLSPGRRGGGKGKREARGRRGAGAEGFWFSHDRIYVVPYS